MTDNEMLSTILNTNKLDTDIYIYRSYNLIESSYNLTLNEQRLVYLASKKLQPIFIKANIKPSQLKTLLGYYSFKGIKIYVNEFKEAFKLKSNNLYAVLADTADKLYKETLYYMTDTGGFIKKRWVITCEYNAIDKFVSLTFHPDLLMDLLLLRSKFGRFKFEYCTKFKSTYTFRLYELLQSNLYKKVRVFTVSDLRYKLGIYDDKKYRLFNEFKRNVIEPSVKSINELTDLNITVNYLYAGRKVDRIEFIISQKATHNMSNTVESISITDDIRNMWLSLVPAPISDGQIAILTDIIFYALKRHNIDMAFFEYLEFEINVVSEYSKVTKINNYFSVLRTALIEYWLPNKPMQQLSGNSYLDSLNMDKLESGLLGWEELNLINCQKEPRK